MPWSSKNTKNSVIKQSNPEGQKSPFWISVNISDTFKTHMNLRNQHFCVTIFRREKDRTEPVISYLVYLIMVDMSFS